MVKEGLHIRRATTNDAKLLCELSTVTFFDTFKGTCTDEDMQEFIEQYFNEKQIYEELQDPDDFYFIIFLEDIAAGYIRIKEDKTDIDEIKSKKGIELKRIYVLKEYHSKKIGARLTRVAKARGKRGNGSVRGSRYNIMQKVCQGDVKTRKM